MSPNERLTFLCNLVFGDEGKSVKNYKAKRMGHDVWEIIAIDRASGSQRVEGRLAGGTASDVVKTYNSMPPRIADIFMFGVFQGAKTKTAEVFG